MTIRLERILKDGLTRRIPSVYWDAMNDTTRAPKFGEWFTGIYASDDNPTKHGMYVKTIRRTERMNRGTHYELTDGKGRFWQYPVEFVVRSEQS